MAKFKVLFLEQLLNLRQGLVFLVFVQTVVPVAFVFAMGHYAGVTPARPQLLHIIAGSVTFTLAFLGLTSMAGKITLLRQQGALVHYISLPINKITFMAALLSARLVFLLPGIIAPLLAGFWLYGIDLNLSLWLPLIMVTGIISLSVIGTALGAYIKSYDLLNVLTGCLIFIMALVAPTFMPASVLPLSLQLLGWLLPTTYLSDALSRSLGGVQDLTFFLDIVILLVMAGLALVVTRYFLIWRAD